MNFVPVLEKKTIQITIQNIHKVESLWIEEERDIEREPSGIIVQKNIGNQARKLPSKI
jgi:hypothetical protein